MVAHGSLHEVPWPCIEQFKPETALHFAWIATPGIYLDSPENETLVEQSEAFFRGLSRRGVRHLAGTGTCIEYAPSSRPLRETDSPLAPIFPYSRAKVETSRRLEASADETGARWSWFRIFYPYGEGEHPERMPSALIRKLLGGETLALKTPDSVKDYIHVTDACRAILSALESGLVGPVNIGTGTGVRIIDLARAIARCCGCDPALVTRAVPLGEDSFPITVADISKLRNATGWNPAISLEEGLRRLLESFTTQRSHG